MRTRSLHKNVQGKGRGMIYADSKALELLLSHRPGVFGRTFSKRSVMNRDRMMGEESATPEHVAHRSSFVELRVRLELWNVLVVQHAYAYGITMPMATSNNIASQLGTSHSPFK